ncbi:MAG: LysR family transcriptional regulator [Alphaproteobacteria bacterium]
MDTLTSMKVFHAAVTSGSFSEAGRQLGMAPSSVSRQISALEDHLGVQLLNRSTRQLHLTEAGETYHDRVINILQSVEDAAVAVTELESSPRGLLRINMPVTFGRRHVAPFFPEFMQLYPEVEIEATMTDNLVNIIEEGADLVIRIGELQDSSLIARKLAPNNRVIAASPEYLDRFGEPMVPSDLADHVALTYRRQAGPDIFHFDGPRGVEHVRMRSILHVNNGEAILPAARAGQGLVLLPTYVVGRDIQTGRLRPVMTDLVASPTALDTSIYAMYPPNRHLSPKVRAFVDFLLGKYGNPPYWDVEDPSHE